MRKVCMSCYFQVNNQRQKTSGDTAAMCCFHRFDGSSQTKWRKNINKPSRKNIIKYKPLSLRMKNTNRKFWGWIKRLMTSANRHIARRGCFDNVLCFIKKNSGEVHPYYIIRCQYKQLEKHKQWLRLRYPNMEVADKCDDPSAIHWWNRFKREVIKKPNYCKNYFRPTEEKRELLETALDITL